MKVRVSDQSNFKYSLLTLQSDTAELAENGLLSGVGLLEGELVYEGKRVFPFVDVLSGNANKTWSIQNKKGFMGKKQKN